MTAATAATRSSFYPPRDDEDEWDRCDCDETFRKSDR